jgi:rhamnose transport system substrate-binding protein
MKLRKCFKFLTLVCVSALLLSVSVEYGFAKATSSSGKTIKIAVLPKMKGENYWDACKVGAQQAVDELTKAGHKVQFIYDGPPQDQATNQKQVSLLEGWIAQGVNVIVMGVIDPNAIAPTLKKAKARGIKVVTFDADSTQPGTRDIFINQVSNAAVAKGLLDATSKQLKADGYGEHNKANIAIVAQTKTDENHQAWLAEVKRLLATPEYNYMQIKNESTDLYYPGADETQTETQCGTLISRMGEGADKIQAAIAFTSMAAPALGAQYLAAAVKPDKNKIVLTGLATPNALRTYILNKDVPLKTGVLWNCMDLGYLAVQTGYQLATGEITTSSKKIVTKRLGEKAIGPDGQIILGNALVFDASNVKNFNY